ncbi:MAG: alkaline phosphatase D family protein [Acidimicrobiales bacterium]
MGAPRRLHDARRAVPPGRGHRQQRPHHAPPHHRTPLASGAAIFDPDRTCLGAEQKAWFKERITSGDFTWRHIGHGYPFVALRLEDYDTPEVRANPPAGFHENGGKYLSTEQ